MFRIKTTLNGKYIVEVSSTRLFGLIKIWKPYVKSSGLDEAWEHQRYSDAMNNLLSQVEDETNKNSV